MNKRSPPLATAVLRKIDAYGRAANYLSVGQIYLYDNPLLKKPLTLAHIKPRLLGHWRTTPGLNLRRMSANPHANGGLLLRGLRLPDFRDYAVTVPQPGAVDAEAYEAFIHIIDSMFNQHAKWLKVS